MSKESTNRTENESEGESNASLENSQFGLSPSFSNFAESNSCNGRTRLIGEQYQESLASPVSSLDEELMDGINDAFASNLYLIKKKLKNLSVNFSSTEVIGVLNASERYNGFCEEPSYLSEQEVLFRLQNERSNSFLSEAFMDHENTHYHAVFPTIDERPELEEMETARTYEVPEKKICLRDEESCIVISKALSKASMECGGENSYSNSISKRSIPSSKSLRTTTEIYIPPKDISVPIPISCFDGTVLPPFLKSQSVQYDPDDFYEILKSPASSSFELGLNLPSSIDDDSCNSIKSTPIEPNVVILDKNDNNGKQSMRNKISPLESPHSTTKILFQRRAENNSNRKNFSSSSSSKLSNYSSHATSKTNNSSLQRKFKQIYTNNREHLHLASSRKSSNCSRQKLLGSLDVPKIFKEKHAFPSITKIVNFPQDFNSELGKGDFELEGDNCETKKDENLFSQVQVHPDYKDRARMLINSPTLSPMRRVYEIKNAKVVQSGDFVSRSENGPVNDLFMAKSSDNTKNCLLRKIPTTTMAYYAISSDDDSDEVVGKVGYLNTIIEVPQNDESCVNTCCCCFLFKKTRWWNFN